MGTTINARLPMRVEQKLAEYCAKRGVKRSEAVVRALDQYLDRADRHHAAAVEWFSRFRGLLLTTEAVRLP